MELEPPTSADRHAGASRKNTRATPRREAISVPASAEFRAFDADSPARSPTRISLEMRASAWTESSTQGSAIFYRDEAELLQPR